MSQYAAMPTPYTMKFIIMVWLAFFARARPVSTIAKPACMNMTRKPVTSVQMKFDAMTFCPTVFTRSATVSPFFASPTGMSLTVPVMVPAGSPFTLSSAEGPLTLLMSASVMGTGAGAAAAGAAGGAAGSGAGAGACARATPAASSHDAANAMRIRLIISPLPLPQGVLLVGGVDESEDPAETQRDTHQHDHEPQDRKSTRLNSSHEWISY